MQSCSGKELRLHIIYIPNSLTDRAKEDYYGTHTDDWPAQQGARAFIITHCK